MLDGDAANGTVDVSGQFRFRTNSNDVDGAAKAVQDTDVEVEVGIKVPVTDMVTAVFKIDSAPNNGPATTRVEDYYFSYANAGTTVNYGQQNIPGRLTDGLQGDGLVVLQNLGSFTVGGAYFFRTNLGGLEDVASVIAMGNAGPVSLLAQYADVANIGSSYNVKADAKLGMVSLGAEHTETNPDKGTADYATTKVYASGNVGIVTASVAYATTGKDGSGSTHAVVGSSSAAEAPSEVLLWNVGSAKVMDLEAYVASISAKVTDKISVKVAMLDGDAANGTVDVSETLGQISYKAAKNLSTYLRVANYDKGNGATDEGTRSRIEIKYSF
jgi:hypothetical protein